MLKLNGCIFLIQDNDSLKKYNSTCDKVSCNIEKEIDSKPVYNKTKIKSYCDEVTGCHDKEMSKAGSYQTCFKVISIDSAFEKEENYYG